MSTLSHFEEVSILAFAWKVGNHGKYSWQRPRLKPGASQVQVMYSTKLHLVSKYNTNLVTVPIWSLNSIELIIWKV